MDLKPEVNSNTSKSIALGLSASALPLIQRLKKRSHVKQIALTPSAASTLDTPLTELLVAPAREVIAQSWHPKGLIIIVGAIAAVTRLVAPHLKSKEEDPAVLVLDAKAQVFVPLLGGHRSGAESLSLQLAEEFCGKAVLTADSISQGRLAIDAFGDSWGWKRSVDEDGWKKLSFSQARGEILRFEQSSGSDLWQTCEATQGTIQEVSNEINSESTKLDIGPYLYRSCSWHPATLWIGIGCERNTSHSLFERALLEAFTAANLSMNAVAGVASIVLKKDESSLVRITSERGWPLKLFRPEELSEVQVPNPSSLVKSEVGTPSVAEASALLAAGVGGVLLNEKQVFHSKGNECGALTIAITEAIRPFAPHLGELHLVGSGPGDLSFLTPDARAALSRSVVWIGYERYLDLLEPLRRPDQVRINGKLTKEIERCSQALKLAQEGIRVAMVSSGDSGIYGMGGLVLERWLEINERDRPNLQYHPGLTAVQIAAAKVGAPLMSDFCTISLSDRLTSWETIEARLRNAAEGDFVVALYNPQSEGRRWQLQRALEIFQAYRSFSTPVVVARQLGREGEAINLQTLAKVAVSEVDMLTLVLVGNSTSYLQDGKMVTLRGYPHAELEKPH